MLSHCIQVLLDFSAPLPTLRALCNSSQMHRHTRTQIARNCVTAMCYGISNTDSADHSFQWVQLCIMVTLVQRLCLRFECLLLLFLFFRFIDACVSSCKKLCLPSMVRVYHAPAADSEPVRLWIQFFLFLLAMISLLLVLLHAVYRYSMLYHHNDGCRYCTICTSDSL